MINLVNHDKRLLKQSSEKEVYDWLITDLSSVKTDKYIEHVPHQKEKNLFYGKVK